MSKALRWSEKMVSLWAVDRGLCLRQFLIGLGGTVENLPEVERHFSRKILSISLRQKRRVMKLN